MSKNALALLFGALCFPGCANLGMISFGTLSAKPKPEKKFNWERERPRIAGALAGGLILGLATHAEAQSSYGVEKAVGEAFVLPMAAVGAAMGYGLVTLLQNLMSWGGGGGEGSGSSSSSSSYPSPAFEPPLDPELKAIQDILAAKGPSRPLYERQADVLERKGYFKEALAAVKRAESLGPPDALLAKRRARLEARIRASEFPFLPH